jgi:hypothetical protein
LTDFAHDHCYVVKAKLATLLFIYFLLSFFLVEILRMFTDHHVSASIHALLQVRLLDSRGGWIVSNRAQFYTVSPLFPPTVTFSSFLFVCLLVMGILFYSCLSPECIIDVLKFRFLRFALKLEKQM